MVNTSAIWQQAAHTTYQLSSPSCSTRAIQKSLTLSEKCLTIFWKKSQKHGPLAEKWQDRKSKRTRQKNETGDRKEESSDSPEIPDRGWGGDIRHPRPLFRGCIQHKFCCYLQSSDRSSYRLTMECLWLCSTGFQLGSSDCSHHTPPAGKYFLWQYLIFREWKRHQKT